MLDIIKVFRNVLVNTAFKQCEKCPNKEKHFNDYTGVYKAIERVIKHPYEIIKKRHYK